MQKTVVMHKASNDQIEHPYICSLAFTWWQWQLRVANKLLTLQVCSNFYLSKLLVSCEPSKKSKSERLFDWKSPRLSFKRWLTVH